MYYITQYMKHFLDRILEVLRPLSDRFYEHQSNNTSLWIEWVRSHFRLTQCLSHRRGVETAIQAVLCPFDDAPAKQTPYDPLFGLSILSMSIALTHQDSWGSEILGGRKFTSIKEGRNYVQSEL